MVFNLRRAKKQQQDVVVDSVTGAFNRRQLDADVAAGIDMSDQPTATLMIDVDAFAGFTGKKGSVSGDQVLERVSWVIMATVRTTDVVYRHGASSFCVLLPATRDEDAVAVADRIRANVQQMPLLAESHVTVSVGVATGSGQQLAQTIERAEGALTEGSTSGPNQVFAVPPTVPTNTPSPPPPPPVPRAAPAVHPPITPEPNDPLAPPSI
ncbi:MAG: GGDEF domain-containing protein [Ilumatobacter sp.]